MVKMSCVFRESQHFANPVRKKILPSVVFIIKQDLWRKHDVPEPRIAKNHVGLPYESPTFNIDL